MLAKYIRLGIPVARITVSYIISARHIETAIIALWVSGRKPTKHLIKMEIAVMLYINGSNGADDWVTEEQLVEYNEKASLVAKKLYPTFYK